MSCNWLSTFIKNRDWFGHPVSLSFDNKGSKHNTCIGGIFSVLVNAAFIAYSLAHLQKMVFFLDDKISQAFHTVEFDEIGEVDSKDMDF